MSLLRRGGTRRAAFVTAVSLGMFQALAVVGAVPAGAVQPGGCTYNASTDTVTVQMDAGETARIAVVDATPGGAADEIQITVTTGGVAPVDCGSAQVSNTVLVVVLGSGATAADEVFEVDNADTGGSFGSIGFSIDMGNNTALGGDTFRWIGSDGADTVVVTNTTFVANGGNGELVGVEIQDFELGDGDDSFDASGSSTALGDVDDATIPPGCNSPGVSGGDGDDVILGSSGDDFIEGNPGAPGAGETDDDEIHGNDGDDCIFGDTGDDTLSGDGGNDSVEGEEGSDFVDEGAAANGADTLIGDSPGVAGDIDHLHYGDRTTATAINMTTGICGADANADGDSADTGDEGDDCTGDFEILMTGSAADTLVGDGSDELFIPQGGDDTADGNAGVDTMSWSTAVGPIVVNSAAGTSTGDGNDTFTDMEIVDGSANPDDLLDFSGETGAVGASLCTGVVTGATSFGGVTGADLGVGDAPGEAGLCTSTFEHLVGSPGNDALSGDSQRNVLDGGDGNDSLAGNFGNDNLLGRLGNDSYNGGSGADAVNFRFSPNGVVVDLSLGFASGEGDDSFVDVVEIIIGSDFADNITGGPFAGGGTVNFRFIGRKGNDILTGFSGNDTLRGGAGKDVTRGSAGDDIMAGGRGNDRLFGGSGTDVGRGGPGADVCRGVEIRRSCGTPQNPRAPQAARLV
jgi:Ca2+-binding RTX toxin-like protein